MNAHENDLELGLTELADEEDLGWQDEPATLSMSSKGKQLATGPKEILEDKKVESDSWDGNSRPRKFWIPSNDVSCIMGGMREANLSGSSVGGADWSNQAARFSTGLEPSDVAWASDFVLDG
ncbi:MAG: hypothetical protein M1823_008442, partial [Watsoniomyces obsoletus]